MGCGAAVELITRLLVKDARVRVDMETAQAHAFFSLDGAPVDWGRVAAKGYEPPLLPPPELVRGSCVADSPHFVKNLIRSAADWWATGRK